VPDLKAATDLWKATIYSINKKNKEKLCNLHYGSLSRDINAGIPALKLFTENNNPSTTHV
jgi:hypothetical protein